MKNFLIILGFILVLNVSQYAIAEEVKEQYAQQATLSIEESTEALKTAEKSLTAAKNNLINAHKTLKKAQKDNKSAIIAKKKSDNVKKTESRLALKKQKKQDKIKQAQPKTEEEITAEKIANIKSKAEKKVVKIQEEAACKAEISKVKKEKIAACEQAKAEKKLAVQKKSENKKIAAKIKKTDEKNLAAQKKAASSTLIAQRKSEAVELAEKKKAEKQSKKDIKKNVSSKEVLVSNNSKRKFKPIASDVIPAVKLTDDFVVSGSLNYADNRVQITKLLNMTDKQQKTAKEICDNSKGQIASLNSKIDDKEQEAKMVKLSRISIEFQNEKLKKIDLELNNLYLERDRIHNSGLRKFEGLLDKKQKNLWEDMKKQGAKFLPDPENN